MDSLLLWLTFLLLGVGIVSVYDASYAIAVEKLHGDSFHFVKMQVGVGVRRAARAARATPAALLEVEKCRRHRRWRCRSSCCWPC